jgi:hypothetical protein
MTFPWFEYSQSLLSLPDSSCNPRRIFFHADDICEVKAFVITTSHLSTARLRFVRYVPACSLTKRPSFATCPRILDYHSELQFILFNNTLSHSFQLRYVPRTAQIPPTQPLPLLAAQPHAESSCEPFVVAQEFAVVPGGAPVVLSLGGEDGAGMSARSMSIHINKHSLAGIS